MQSRRSFLKQASIAGLLIGTGQFPLRSFAAAGLQQLSILHTNDTHSRLEPLPPAAGIKGCGGIVARAALIQDIRAENTEVLLLDAGDFLQGGPYYDLYKGEPEIRAMDLMQYDAVTLGEHDLYDGMEQLALQLASARFAIVCSNCSFTTTALEHIVKPYTVLRKGGMKIGIMGIGLPLQGLVPDHIAKALTFDDPLETATATAAKLRRREHCDMVICLSRLGLPEYNTLYKIDDRILAKETSGIDLLIGGRTHTFLDHPISVRNKKGNEIWIAQAGWGGTQLGRLNYIFSDKKRILSANAQTVILGK
jgi:5'-nucleotidase